MHKKSVAPILYSTIGVIVMALIVVAFNVITGAFYRRVDLTKEKAFTLSDGTRAILASLDTPVKLRFYWRQIDSTSPYVMLAKSYAKKVDDLLAEYKQAGRGKIIVERLDPQPDSDAEDSARLDGVEEQFLPGNDQIYLGLSVSLLDSKEAIPFLSPERERQLEYDISRAITRVVRPGKPVIGIMSSLPVFGTPGNPMMAQMGQQGQEPWTIVNELKNDFTVKGVELDAEKIDDDIRLLVVIHPSGISDKAQFAIDQFILRGGKLIAFLDPQSWFESRNRNPMMGGPQGGGSSLDKLLKAWGLEFDTGKIVADRTFKWDQEGPQRIKPYWLMVTPLGINSEDLATGQLDSFWYFSGGAFVGTPAPGLKETVLLHSTKDSQLIEAMLANFGGENLLSDFKPSGTNYPLAVRLTGKFKSAFPDGPPEEKKDETAKADGQSTTNAAAEKKPANSLKESKEDTTVILIGDSDMIFDPVALEQIRTPFGILLQPRNGNLSFAQGAIEQLSGDENLIAVRSRAVLNHPFTRVKAIEAVAEAKYEVKEKELEERKQQAARRINELQQYKSESQRSIPSPEQQAELDKLYRARAEIGKELHQVDKDKKRETDALKTRLKWINILSMPAAISLVGIGLAIYKRKRTSAK